MPTDLEDRMLGVLAGRRAQDQTTISDFARMFGASRELVASCTQRMVESGSALGCYVDRRGIATLHGLRPQPTAAHA